MKPQAFIAHLTVSAGEFFELDWNDQILEAERTRQGQYALTILRRQG